MSRPGASYLGITLSRGFGVGKINAQEELSKGKLVGKTVRALAERAWLNRRQVLGGWTINQGATISDVGVVLGPVLGTASYFAGGNGVVGPRLALFADGATVSLDLRLKARTDSAFFDAASFLLEGLAGVAQVNSARMQKNFDALRSGAGAFWHMEDQVLGGDIGWVVGGTAQTLERVAPRVIKNGRAVGFESEAGIGFA
jgi:hypothetical protein